jgi:hypothetical protein
MGNLGVIAEDWWPDMLRHIADEKPWDTDHVVVAELRSFDDPWLEGSRTCYTALIRVEDLERLDGKLISFNYNVETSGPGPSPAFAGSYVPAFWISAILGDERIKCEPLVLAWESNNRTAMILDPGFCMTYGLIPRALDDGSIHWDDMAVPEFDIAVIDSPSIYNHGVHSGARVTVDRDHLQDYLTQRGMALVEVYFENRRSVRDDAIDAALGDKDRIVNKFANREVDFWRRDEGGYGAQIWGARVIARPKDLPISMDPLESQGLVWPGMEGAITLSDASSYRPWDTVFVRDTVLGAYEGKPGFNIHPETGGVSYGNQWGIGPSVRVGRDVLRLEIRKLHEGTARRVIQHWHAHAIMPTPDLLKPEAQSARNIGSRSHDLIYAMALLGSRLAELADLIGAGQFTARDVAGVMRHELDYGGWWNAAHVEPITRHVVLGMDRVAFLDRCIALAKVVAEPLAQRLLRPMIKAVAGPPDKISDFGSLKLLNRIISLAQVANDAGLMLWSDGQEITDRLARDGTEPANPLDAMFALVDLRQAAAHRKDEADAIVADSLPRFGIALGSTASGWGAALDTVYDRLIDEIERAAQTVGDALHL